MAEIQGANVQTIPGLSVSGDISSKQYHFVKAASTANQVIAVAGSTDVAIGVLLDAPDAANESALVGALGIMPLVAGTSVITYGSRVGYDSTGRVGTYALKVGVAMEAPGAAGDIIKVLVTGL